MGGRELMAFWKRFFHFLINCGDTVETRRRSLMFSFILRNLKMSLLAFSNAHPCEPCMPSGTFLIQHVHKWKMVESCFLLKSAMMISCWFRHIRQEEVTRLTLSKKKTAVCHCGAEIWTLDAHI